MSCVYVFALYSGNFDIITARTVEPERYFVLNKVKVYL